MNSLADTFFPRSAVGWLLTAVIVGCTLAPSLEPGGTWLRVGLALLCGITFLHTRSTNYRRLPPVATVGLVLLLVALVVCLLSAPTLAYGFTRLINWVMFIPLLPLIHTRKDLGGVIFGLLLTGCLQMLGVWLQISGVMEGTWGAEYAGERTIRYTGFLLNPNDLGLVLTLSSIALVALVFTDHPLIIKALALTFAALFVVGILLSGSRGGIVAFVLGFVVVLGRHQIRGVLAAIVLGGGGLLALRAFGSESAERAVRSLGDIWQGEDVSAGLRADLWTGYLEHLDISSLIFGRGFGGYAPELFANQSGLDVSREAARAATIDNSWLKLILEGGLVAALGMSLLFLSAAAIAFKVPKAARSLGNDIALAFVLALLWRSLTVDMLDVNPWNALVFLTFGLCYVYGAPPDESPQQARTLARHAPGTR